MFIMSLLETLRSSAKTHVELAAENALLRYQLEILKRRRRRITLERWDRPILLWLSRFVPNWKKWLVIVQPETLSRWHRKGFSIYWGCWIRRKGGRNLLNPNAVSLIQEISRANPLWGVPRIHGELLKLGIKVSPGTIHKYRFRHLGPRGQNWKTFLKNHMDQTVAIDFFVVPTIRFRVLWALVVLSHDRRKILYTAVTPRPSNPWTMQQLRNAFPYNSLPKILLHDRDHSFYGLSRLGVDEVVTGFRAPWQNAYVERVIGSIRRESMDHFVVLGERHLQKILKGYTKYYNECRTHLALNKDAPVSRSIQRTGKIFRIPKMGGLHHVYYRKSA
jgi:transposase InsO family protein